MPSGVRRQFDSMRPRLVRWALRTQSSPAGNSGRNTMRSKPTASTAGWMPPRRRKNQADTEPNIGWLCEKVLSLPAQCSHSVVAPFSSIQPQEGNCSPRANSRASSARPPRHSSSSRKRVPKMPVRRRGPSSVCSASTKRSSVRGRRAGGTTPKPRAQASSDWVPAPTAPVAGSRKAASQARADSSAQLRQRAASSARPSTCANRSRRRAVSTNIGVSSEGPPARSRASWSPSPFTTRPSCRAAASVASQRSATGSCSSSRRRSPCWRYSCSSSSGCTMAQPTPQ
jgi:hypothetical protein